MLNVCDVSSLVVMDRSRHNGRPGLGLGVGVLPWTEQPCHSHTVGVHCQVTASYVAEQRVTKYATMLLYSLAWPGGTEVDQVGWGVERSEIE